MIILPLCRFRFLSDITVLPKGLPSRFLCSAGLLMMYFASFSLSENVLLLTLFFERYFHWVKNCGFTVFFFSFHTRMMLFHRLLACVTFSSVKKFSAIFIFISLNVICLLFSICLPHFFLYYSF